MLWQIGKARRFHLLTTLVCPNSISLGGSSDRPKRPAPLDGAALDCAAVTAPRKTRRRHATLADELPRIGRPGSRSAELHTDARTEMTPAPPRLGGGTAIINLLSPARLRWLGTLGALLIGLGGLGGGALPVVENPWSSLPLGALMGRMMLASNAVVLVGVGMLVAAWLMLAPFVGAITHSTISSSGGGMGVKFALATQFAWVFPLIGTAPLFTQDIYSYLANGLIVRQGLDPYSAGPVELLGVEHHLARSVPFIWAHSPSPYGPVALGIAAAISWFTGDSILWGVLAHRALSIAGIFAAAWGVIHLARRCGVRPAAALWLGLLNPLTILHLVGGIHNEALMVGFVLIGLEVGLRGVDGVATGRGKRAWLLLVASGALVTLAGLVKVSGFIGLGFVGMALARELRPRMGGPRALLTAAGTQTVLLIATAAAVARLTGIGFGWVTGQGGAASIRSWLSLTTDIGVIGGALGMWLGLGDHTDAMLAVTRAAGIAIAVAFMARMLWATYRGTIHPVGGLGVSTLVLVMLFPVVHPWYPLWAILPLAAWANRPFFRAGVAAYSAIFSFLVLPRGLALPPGSVATVYGTAALSFAGIFALTIIAVRLRFRRVSGQGLHSPA